MEENLKNQLDQISNSIDSKIEKSNNDVANTIEVKASEIVKSEVTEMSNKLNERLDAFEVANKKQFNANKKMTFKSALSEAIENGAIEGITKGNSRSARFEIKADMTVGADFTGEVIPADRVAGYKFDPTRPVHIRQLLSLGSTQSDVVRYVKESGYSNGAAVTAEGVTLTQSDFDMTAVDANVKKIGTYFRISEEMLADTPQLTSYLSARAPEKLLDVEDVNILTGNDLGGIVNSAPAFAAGSYADTVESANQFDVIVAALNQLSLLNYNADTILLNPTDFHKILLLKDTTNNYIKDAAYGGLQPVFMGVKVVLNSAIAAGDFLIGNFGVGTQLWVREGVNIEFFREDGTNVRDGFVTVRVSERIALTNYLPNAFVKGQFATAQAALETP
jgi:HK97 family phage major capsid protein|tara:strand:+ start:1323 stop:2495 length:1173 start_codon:yes stop_codon:yes gene_type:complete